MDAQALYGFATTRNSSLQAVTAVFRVSRRSPTQEATNKKGDPKAAIRLVRR